jgi:hypothetical protein
VSIKISRSITISIFGLLTILFIWIAVHGLKLPTPLDFMPTQKTRAVVIQVELAHIGRNYYKQQVHVQFQFNNNTFTTIEKLGKRWGRIQKGDTLIVEFASSNPELNKIIGWPAN